MSLFARIAAAIVSLVVLGTLLTSFVVIRIADTELVAARSRDLEAAAAVAETRFVDRVAEVKRTVTFLAGTPPIDGLIRAQSNSGVDPKDGSSDKQWRDRLATIFRELLESQPYYVQARYIGRAEGGRELVRVERHAGDTEIRRTPEKELQGKASEPYFEGTLSLSRGELYVSPINLNRERGAISVPHVPVYRVATPVGAPGAPHFGLIIVNVDARETLSDLGEAGAGQAYVLRPDGHYLLHPDPTRTFGFDLGHAPTGAADLPLVMPVVTEELPLLTVEDEASGRILTARPLFIATGQKPVTLVLTTAYRGLSAAPRLPLLAPVLLIGALSLALGLFATRWLVRPVTKLTKAVDQMTDTGGLAVPRGLAPELQNLAETLEHSIDALRARDRLEASNRELQQFAYLASHDLREPIRTIASYLELLDEDYGELLEGDGQDFIRFMRSSTVRMTTLIDGLLEHARLGSGATAESVDTHELLGEVVADLAASIDAKEATVFLGDELPRLRGYRLELRLLFQNLLSNALKFGREGVAPEVRFEAEARENRTWQFRVTDNGPGIPEDKRDRVFEIFQRLHTREAAEGSGIGLAHCRKIVSLHRGQMWIEDPPGEHGARFCFTLHEVES